MSYTTPVNGLEILLLNQNTIQSKSQWVFFNSLKVTAFLISLANLL
jgi:hypothetical protein